MHTVKILPLLVSLLACQGGLIGIAAAQPAAANVQAKPDLLPIKSIALYRSGVGSFERHGLIDGNRMVQLRFNTDQINDILKSMIVLDLSKNGRVGGVSYASRDPLSKRLASFGVDISDAPSLGILMSRLRGAKVSITVPDGQFAGIVVGGETRSLTTGASPTAVPVSFINLLTAAGIKSLNLSMASNIEVQDKDLANELQRALAAVAEHRADRTKTVDVNFVGEGSREVMIGYEQEAPVWKASYRLELPDLKAETPAKDGIKDKLSMQGWAIVENTTDEDWNNIELSLVSGQPVSFRMDLYQPLYAFRPIVPVPTVPGVAPRIFEGSVSSGQVDQEAAPAPSIAYGKAKMDLAKPGAPAKARVDRRAMADESGLRAAGATGGFQAEDMINYAPAAQARAAESGEVFEYHLEHPVTIERQRSAMLPIITSAVSGRRVSIFTPADSSTHPMRGVEMVNDSGLQLLPGPIAVYDDGTYAGDAQIGHVPASDKRLLAYSVDLEVDSTSSDDQNSRIEKLRIVHGMIEMTSLSTSKVKYTFANKDAKRGRTIIVEQPKDDSWTLKAPAKPYETTDTLHRFIVEVAAAKVAVLEIVRERIDRQGIEVNSMTPETLLSYRTNGAAVSESVLEAVKKAGSFAATVRQIDERIAALAKEKAEIDADQTRIRQNMGSIDRASELYGKYMK